MKCPQCEKEYPSHHYFVTETMCSDCFGSLSEEDQKRMLGEAEKLSSEGAEHRTVDGHDLRCPICAHDVFWKRQTLLNTPGLTFFGVEWANKKADNYVCDRCGHILWFLREVAGR